MLKTSNEKLISYVDKMPAFPKSVQRILQLSIDINSSAKEMVQVIESDPVMTLKILKVINSVFYGGISKITSIQRAVIYMGMNTIKNLALGIATIGTLNPDNKANFNTQDFLFHSLTTAFLCKKLAEKLKVSKIDHNDFFVAGLLHDFGKLVFTEFEPEAFKKALERSQQLQCSLHESEQVIMGITHAEAGRLLMHKWQFNESLVNVIYEHHNPTKKNIIGDCIFAANQISKRMQFGFAGNPVVEEFPPLVFDRFQCSLDTLITDLGDLSMVKTEALSFIRL